MFTGKIIKLDDDLIYVGMGDGSFKEFQRVIIDFVPNIGDMVEIYENDDKTIILRTEVVDENSLSNLVQEPTVAPLQVANSGSKKFCPNCGSKDVKFDTFQETVSSSKIGSSISHTKQKGKGCLYWLLIGWWWWIIDIMLWIFLFPFRAIFALTRKKKYVTTTTNTSKITNEINYKTRCTCNSCGHSWNND